MPPAGANKLNKLNALQCNSPLNPRESWAVTQFFQITWSNVEMSMWNVVTTGKRDGAQY